MTVINGMVVDVIIVCLNVRKQKRSGYRNLNQMYIFAMQHHCSKNKIGGQVCTENKHFSYASRGSSKSATNWTLSHRQFPRMQLFYFVVSFQEINQSIFYSTESERYPEFIKKLPRRPYINKLCTDDDDDKRSREITQKSMQLSGELFVLLLIIILFIIKLLLFWTNIAQVMLIRMNFSSLKVKCNAKRIVEK